GEDGIGDWSVTGVQTCALPIFPKGETYIQAGPIVPISQALDAPWPKESTHKFRLLRDQRAVRDFDGGTFRLASVDEFPASKTMKSEERRVGEEGETREGTDV